MQNGDHKKPEGAWMAQANRLHHFSMMYTGALYELASGRHIAVLSREHPGLQVVRDLCDQVLMARAEVNGLTRVMIEAGLLTKERVHEVMEAEYKYMADQKGLQFKCESTDVGLVFKPAQSKHEGG